MFVQILLTFPDVAPKRFWSQVLNGSDITQNLFGAKQSLLRTSLQVVMAVFAYVYYSSYVAPASLSVGGVLSQVMKLNERQQVRVGGFPASSRQHGQVAVRC